ncbi:MAG: shikimate dehydrogenase [Halobacteriales archaeon]|nr:shikimate dehydrogenase [Halobacteriales archaeon]
MEVYGLVGNPVGHSRSPPLHEAAYEALGMDARYVTFEPAEGDLGPALDGAAALGIAGLNVTTPFKRAALDHVEPDGLAARIGAVNTIEFGPQPPRGYNTDAAGVRRALERHGVELAGTTALVVGAGGAGRAIAVALDDAGATVDVANRTVERAEAVAGLLDGGGAYGLDALAELVPAAELLVNATTVGLDEDRSPVPAELLGPHLTVMDAVYSPLETRLLREAAAAGAETVDGGWMLLYQGVEAFERWTGREAPVAAMNEALRARL